MLNKRIFVIALLAVLCCSLLALPIHATSNIHGFGSYYVEEVGGNLVVYIDEGGTMTSDQTYWKDKLDLLMEQYGRTITFVTGALTITLVIVFIWLCVKSAYVASEHWILKRQTMIAMLWVGIGTALMGSTTLILILFQNAFI